jgi:hypothetical protein
MLIQSNHNTSFATPDYDYSHDIICCTRLLRCIVLVVSCLRAEDMAVRLRESCRDLKKWARRGDGTSQQKHNQKQH